MKSNIFKKIIALTYLIIFIFSLLIPFNQSFAQTPTAKLTVSTTGGTNNVNLNTKVYIEASISGTKGGQVFSFIPGNGYTIEPKTCTIPTNTTTETKYCGVSFQASKLGSYGISANIYNNQTEFAKDPINNVLNIIPTTASVNVICDNPLVPNATKDACVTPAVGVTGSTTVNTDTTYTPLAPLPGLGTPNCETIDADGNTVNCIDTKATESNVCPFGNYLNTMIKIIIGFSAVLAFIMIVMGGVQYMTSEVISEKSEGKETIKNAIFGLIIGLGAYLILNTINPQLLNACLDKLPEAIITIDGPDAGDDTIDPDFARGSRIYSTNATISPGVTSAIAKIKEGWTISKLTVHTNNKMTIEMKKGADSDYTSVVDIAPGLSGYATSGTAKVNDKKTPLGDWRIIDIKYTPNQAQFNKKGSNMGAAFWHLNPMTSGERGIGIHGNKTGTLGVTNGCIRLKNADILALQEYIKEGLVVSVKQ